MPRRAANSRPEVDVLRIGHRPGRDPRLTTHLALAARAFGARRMWLHPPDPDLAKRLDAVRERWGGSFEVVGSSNWRTTLREFDGLTVHLTMYGQPLERVVRRLRSAPRLLVVAGGAKVPADLYGLAAVNVAVGNEPHSEVAALAVLLHDVLGPPEPGPRDGARQEIVPSARGKKVRKVE